MSSRARASRVPEVESRANEATSVSDRPCAGAAAAAAAAQAAAASSVATLAAGISAASGGGGAGTGAKGVAAGAGMLSVPSVMRAGEPVLLALSGASFGGAAPASVDVAGLNGVKAVHGLVSSSSSVGAPPTNPPTTLLLALVPDDPFNVEAYGAATLTFLNEDGSPLVSSSGGGGGSTVNVTLAGTTCHSSHKKQ